METNHGYSMVMPHHIQYIHKLIVGYGFHNFWSNKNIQMIRNNLPQATI